MKRYIGALLLLGACGGPTATNCRVEERYVNQTGPYHTVCTMGRVVTVCVTQPPIAAGDSIPLPGDSPEEYRKVEMCI